jgi:aminodeoxyfutalosine deaminase
MHSAFASALPKVQLHCHLEGTVGAGTFRELAALHNLESARAAGPLADTYAFETFRDFLLTFAEVCKTLRTPADYARIASDYARTAIAQNVRYAEIFISPSVWTFFHKQLDVAECVRAIRNALQVEAEAAPHGIEVALICDLTRNFGLERAFATARVAVSLAEAGLGVIGIGLGGDEANFPAALYVDAFAYARASGMHAVAHAGEAAGAQSVRDAVELLHAERIGHGVRAVEDPAVVELLVERQVALEICPTSNRLTGAVAAGGPHPLGALDAAGVRCTIDADDTELFSTTLDAEYALVSEWLGEAAVLRFAANAVEASFASPERKAILRAELAAFDLETKPPRRRS